MIRWTYGYQLAAYKKCLEMMGYPVEATYVLHVKPVKRGGQEPCAVLHEFQFDYERFAHLLDVFWTKVYNNQTDWEERSDELAIKKEQATEVELAHVSATQGLMQETQDTSPNTVDSVEALRKLLPPTAYQHQEEISSHERVVEGLVTGDWQPTSRTLTQQEIQADVALGRRTGTQPGIPLEAGEVVLFDKHQRPLKTSRRPSARDTLVRPDEYELDSQQLRRRGIAV
jgi:hypothetical protein